MQNWGGGRQEEPRLKPNFTEGNEENEEASLRLLVFSVPCFLDSLLSSLFFLRMAQQRREGRKCKLENENCKMQIEAWLVSAARWDTAPYRLCLAIFLS